jgi:hypothetical protein
MYVSENQRIGFDLARSGDEPELQLVEFVGAEQGDGGRGEGDGPPSAV